LLPRIGEQLSQLPHADRDESRAFRHVAVERLLLFALAEASPIRASFKRAQTGVQASQKSQRKHRQRHVPGAAVAPAQRFQGRMIQLAFVIFSHARMDSSATHQVKKNVGLIYELINSHLGHYGIGARSSVP